MDLRLLIKNCGGIYAVSKRVKISRQCVHKWIQRGHLPFSDLKGDTDYAGTLERMQPSDASPRLTADEIRHIGLCGANNQPKQRRLAQ